MTRLFARGHRADESCKGAHGRGKRTLDERCPRLERGTGATTSWESLTAHQGAQLDAVRAQLNEVETKHSGSDLDVFKQRMPSNKKLREKLDGEIAAASADHATIWQLVKEIALLVRQQPGQDRAQTACSCRQQQPSSLWEVVSAWMRLAPRWQEHQQYTAQRNVKDRAVRAL